MSIERKQLLINYLKGFKLLADHEIIEFSTLFEFRKVEKNGFFARDGETCNEVAFILSGIFRSFYVSSDGKDTTYCFRFPNELMTAYSAFITGRESLGSIQAISGSELLVVRKERMGHFIHESHNWTKFLKLIAEEHYLELEKRVYALQKDNAISRYQSLLQNHPEYIQQLPLQYLASYLGITQRHLSRIRKEITF